MFYLGDFVRARNPRNGSMMHPMGTIIGISEKNNAKAYHIRYCKTPFAEDELELMHASTIRSTYCVGDVIKVDKYIDVFNKNRGTLDATIRSVFLERDNEVAYSYIIKTPEGDIGGAIRQRNLPKLSQYSLF